MNNAARAARCSADGRVTVDMSAPVFELARMPFDATGLAAAREGGFELWPLELGDGSVEVARAVDGQPACGAARGRRRHRAGRPRWAR